MPCCVPNCSAATSSPQVVRFPSNVRLQERWRMLVRQGTGVALASGRRHEICVGHFTNPERVDYQEPVLFTSRGGQPVKLAVCRLCRNAQHEGHMVQLEKHLAGEPLTLVVLRTLKIRLKPREYSQMICQDCLVMVDLVRRIQVRYLQLETYYQNLLRVIPAEYAEEILHEEVVLDEPKMDVPAEQVVELSESDEAEWPLENEPVAVARTKRQYIRVKPLKPKKPPKPRLMIASSKKCYVCKQSFPRREDLLTHLLENHATPEGYACKECDDKPFETVILYNGHLKYHDASERPLKCDYCNLRFASQETRKKHENLQHGMSHKLAKVWSVKPGRKKPSQQCELCGKLISGTIQMERHKLVHEGSVQCTVCNQTVPSASHLKLHLMRHINEKPFRCSLCEKRYATKNFLKTHIAKIHNQERYFKCRLCNESFYSKTQLRHHARDIHSRKSDNIHGTRLRFKCKLCPEVPRLRSELQAHVEICHAGEQYPFQTCALCPGTKFITKESLNTHRFFKHRKERYVPPARKRRAEEQQKLKEADERAEA